MQWLMVLRLLPVHEIERVERAMRLLSLSVRFGCQIYLRARDTIKWRCRFIFRSLRILTRHLTTSFIRLRPIALLASRLNTTHSITFMDTFAFFTSMFSASTVQPTIQATGMDEISSVPSENERDKDSFTYCIIAWAGLLLWVLNSANTRID